MLPGPAKDGGSEEEGEQEDRVSPLTHAGDQTGEGGGGRGKPGGIRGA